VKISNGRRNQPSVIYGCDRDANPPTVARGVRLDGDRLQPPKAATTVRSRGSRVVVTDGPFAETKEALGGFYLVEARDLDQALEIAKLCPARFGGVEVRPIMVFDGM
jgi:hypothetical protein